MAINRTKVLDAAQKHQRKGNFDKALREYGKLVDDDPTDTRSLLKMADLYTKVGKESDALDSYKQVAYFYLNDDIFDKAVAIFKQAIRLNDQDPSLHRDLGEAYHRMGRLKESVGQYNTAQKIYSNLGDAANQRDILERMVQIEPDDPALRIKLAEHYTRANMKVEALGLFRRAAQQFEEDGRFDDFVKVLERMIFLDSSNNDYRMKAARHYANTNNHKAALKHLQLLFKADPNDIETLQLLSNTFDKLGETKKASLVYLELAKQYRKQGDELRMRSAYQNVLRLDPNNREARAVLAPPPAQKPREDRLDSGAIPGLSDTGNLTGPRGPAHQSHQEPPQRNAMSEVEFLDDDLEDVLAPSRVPQQQPAQPQRPQQQQPPRQIRPEPRPQPPRKQPEPTPPTPQQPAANIGGGGGFADDLLSFAADAISEIGDDLGLDNLQKYPSAPAAPTMAAIQPPPVHEVPMVEIEPLGIEDVEVEPEIAPIEEDVDIKQALDEAKVFMKYGLRDKAVHTVRELVERFPNNIPVREELAQIYIARGDSILAADQHIELAKILRTTPERAAAHLDQAANLFQDQGRVEQIARGLGIPYGQDLAGGDLMEVGFIDEVAPIEDDIDEIQLDEFDLIDEGPSTGSGSFGNGFAPGNNFDDLVEEAGLDFATDNVLTDDAIEIDANDMIDVDTDNMLGEATDVSMNALSVRPQSNPKVSTDNMGFGLTEAEADAMFDDLFGDVSGSATSMSFAGAQDLEGIAEVDFLIDQGMVSEAEAALDSLAQQNPQSATIDRRRLSLADMRTSNNNPFGARSLSGQFSLAFDDPLSEPVDGLDADEAPSLMNVGAATNTNVELGASYMELGLYDEAIEEFKLALDDVSVASVALYNIASCELKLGNPDNAVQVLNRLLQDRNTPEHIRRHASMLLQRVR